MAEPPLSHGRRIGGLVHDFARSEVRFLRLRCGKSVQCLTKFPGLNFREPNKILHCRPNLILIYLGHQKLKEWAALKMFLILIPIIGAFTAWLITKLLFKMLFWPIRPVELPFGIVVRGMLPQKRDELAAGVKEVVENQLRFAAAGEGGLGSDISERLTDTVASAAREHVYQRTPGLVPRTIKIKVADLVEDFIRKEMPGYASSLTENMQKHDFAADISSWAQARIDSYDLAELELRLNSSREIFYIKAGAVTIGFISGLLQLLVVWAVSI